MMARYLQRISLRPFSDVEMWTGWELDGRGGQIEGLISADEMSAVDLERFGVREFQRIPREYLDAVDFDRLKL